MRTRLSRRAIGLVVVLALFAAACGGATDTSPTAGDEATSTTEPSAQDPTTTAGGTSESTATSDSGPNAEARAALRSDVARATEPWPTDWTAATIDVSELQLGIPRVDPRDLIAPIDNPGYQSVEEAGEWLDPDEPGVLLLVEEEARFFPLSMMHRHEIVNDVVAGVPVALTYCPLCNTALGFDRRVDGQTIRLGVSGLLRNSDMVMWDDASTSLWQQLTGEAIVGEFVGTTLTTLPTAIFSFAQFADTYPDGLSIDPASGLGATSYGVNPYQGYTSSGNPFLFDGEIDDRYPALERVIGVSLNGEDKAYPFSLLATARAVNDEVGGTAVAVLWGGSTLDALDAGIIAQSDTIGTGTAYLRDVEGQTLTFTEAGPGEFSDAETGSTWSITGRAVAGPLEGTQLTIATHRNEFWFAWHAFFPDAPVYEQ